MDPTLQKLSLLILTGWSTVKTSVDPLVRPYYTFNELSVADDIVYKGQQAVIPSSMRPAMLEKIHKTQNSFRSRLLPSESQGVSLLARHDV